MLRGHIFFFLAAENMSNERVYISNFLSNQRAYLVFIIHLNESCYLIIFYITGIMEPKTDIQRMEEFFIFFERLIAFVPEFDEWCERFQDAMQQNLWQESVPRSRQWTKNFIKILDTLNKEFHIFFESVPYHHPWMQKNETKLIFFFSEIFRMGQMARTIHAKAVAWIAWHKQSVA